MTVVELAKAHDWNLPTACPICGGALEINEKHTEIKCTNEGCKSKLIGRLKKWTDKLEIKELAPVTLEKFIDANLLNSISGLYTLDFEKIASMEGFGQRSADIYKKNIGKAKKTTLAKFISGFNIDSIGEQIIQKIIDAKSYTTLEDFFNAKALDLVCEGVGEKTANKLCEGIQSLKDDMVKTTKFVEIEKPVAVSTDGKLGGKSFCFTGAASRPRKELWALVESNGGVIFESVKKGLDYLVMADPNSTSSKAQKARKAGVNLISEDAFVSMCN